MINDLEVFDPKLWDVGQLGLTDAQVNQLPHLKETLTNSNLPIADTLRKAEARAWNQTEMHSLEFLMLQKTVKGNELEVTFDLLGKVVARHRVLTGIVSPSPRSMHRINLEKNPFDVDLVGAERLIDRLNLALVKQADTIAHCEHANGTHPISALTGVTLAVLSSVAHRKLLHESMLVGLVEALADQSESLLRLQKHSFGFVLSLAYQGEPDAERRFFVPDLLTGSFIARLSEADVRACFVKGLDPSNSVRSRHKAILSELDSAIRAFSIEVGFGTPLTLKSILEAGRAVAYLHMPAAIAALRCRKAIAHCPGTAVLLRLVTGRAGINIPVSGSSSSPSEVELQKIENEIANIARVEPPWMRQIRDAFRANDRKLLFATLTYVCQHSDDPAGSRIADFALKLLSRGMKPRSVKRHTLLIAIRLGCRLGGVDPSTLDIGALEDCYRDALDDDWDDSAAESELGNVQKNKKGTIEAILQFHHYLQANCNAAALQELAPILKRGGLLPVDANFISIDEYMRVLAYISGPHGIADPYLRSVVRLMIILAFRCGLRRCEAFFLRLEDLDAADHLYVRTYDLRKVKTTNSNRAIPAALFLSLAELNDLRAFMENRQKARHCGEHTLLFSQMDDASKPLNQELIFDIICSAMRASLQDKSLKIHHLRHSFASLVTLKLLLNSSQFVAELFRLHPETLKWLADSESLRAQLFGSSDVRALDLQAVAHLLGHGSPATSVEHYIHVLDFCDF